MKKQVLLTKYKHQLILKNYTESSIRAYENGLQVSTMNH